MILDAACLFSDAQAITADAASTNVIDLQSSATTTAFNGKSILRDLIAVSGLLVFASVDTTFATIVSMSIVLRTDADSPWYEVEVVQLGGPVDNEQSDRGWVGSKYVAIDAP